MKLPGFLLTAVLLAPTPARAQGVPACNASLPAVGRLTVVKPGIRLQRHGGRPVSLTQRGSIDLCLDDRVSTGSGGGRILVEGAPITLASGRTYRMERHRRRLPLIAFLIEELRSYWQRDVSAARNISSSGQGEDGAVFRVDGLSQSTATLVEGRRALRIPFLGSSRARMSLVDHTGRQIPGQRLQRSRYHAPLAVFPELDFVAGARWTVRLDDPDGAITGGFAVVEGPLLLPAAPEALGDDAPVIAALALAGSESQIWSLEAFQRIVSLDGDRSKADEAEIILAAWNIDPGTIPRGP
jgi:hypothetical protein